MNKIREGEKEIWTPGSSEELSSEDLKIKGVKETIEKLGHTSKEQDAQKPEKETPIEKKDYEKMIAGMQEMDELINDSSEIKENGFTYPTEWMNDFEKELFERLDAGETPDIAVVGYGSLQNPESLSKTVSNKITGFVRMKGLRRGMYFSAVGRIKKYWLQAGLDVSHEDSVLAVKHDPDAYCTGIRIPIKMTKEELGSLKQREFAYELLPGPIATTEEGQESKLNLICWPLGREVIDQIPYKREKLEKRKDEMPTNPADTTMRFLDKTQHERYLKMDEEERRKFLKQIPKKTNEEKLESGVATAYHKRWEELYRLDKRPLPHKSYLETCATFGNSKLEEEFLRTTYCYDKNGKEIILTEYLEKNWPKINPKTRPSTVPPGVIDKDKFRTRDKVYN